ncbi:chemotaxis protein [Agrobacterium sp. Azo12]|uniref:chemotaxis protein n=1 Tax=Agrobacterium sp. Azo12 TaxID=3031129 RepID=UPI0023D82022|nr:chemotaxis protein [Agrobacterium sp. Azo12]MDO5896960.1 chemotaxis protein [Agrobacterium sp. Azo12]
MNAKRKLTTNLIDHRADLSAGLSVAHARIEKTFLDGGSVLVSVMEILNDLIAILDRMAGTMDGGTADAAIAGMRKTIEDLARLPDTEQQRQVAFEAMAEFCKSTDNHLDDIRETIRYLKTFAITVKITGAGIAEFSSFADEIRERIQFGADEVGKFGTYLETMRQQLGKARNFSATILKDFQATIPEIIDGLKRNSALVGEQHREMKQMAAQVKSIAQGVQSKIASALSSLQIGDITRQRIEHVQSTMQMLDEYLNSDEGRELSQDEADTLKEAVAVLVNAQLEETTTDLQRDCRKIFAGISSFADDAARILSLRDNLVENTRQAGGGALQLMERDISKACQLAERVQGSSTDADTVVSTVTQTADDLLRGMEVLRSIKTEIHYMALNSNLRCSKLGDEGRSVNVVSAELRVFAEKLESPADAIVSDLQQIETAIGKLGLNETNASNDLSQPLRDALAAVTGAKTEMESGMEDLAREGQAVFSRISSAVVKLDFENELGNVLDECCGLSASVLNGGSIDVASIGEKIQPFSNRIYKLYTMAQERDIHAQYFPVDLAPAKEKVTSSSVDDDDDLFADALF